MTTLQLALVLVASVWAAFNTLIVGYNAINATRDRILTGQREDGIPLTLEHRWLIYRNDWLPLKAALAAVSLAFAGFLVLLPELAESPETLRWLCYVGATLPLFSFLGFFILGLSDRALIVATLKRAAPAMPSEHPS